jgi:hypothetical protein
MEGGIAILLLLIVVVVLGGLGLALYLTGGAISLTGGRKKTDDEDSPRPVHKTATSPELEHTRFAGTPRGESPD